MDFGEVDIKYDDLEKSVLDEMLPILEILPIKVIGNGNSILEMSNKNKTLYLAPVKCDVTYEGLEKIDPEKYELKYESCQDGRGSLTIKSKDNGLEIVLE